MPIRKTPGDPVLNRLPHKERKRQLYIRQQIAREYMGLPPLPGPGRPKKQIDTSIL